MSRVAAPSGVTELAPPRPSSAAWSEDSSPGRPTYKFYLYNSGGWSPNHATVTPPSTSNHSGEPGRRGCGGASQRDEKVLAKQRGGVQRRRSLLLVQVTGDSLVAIKQEAEVSVCGLRLTSASGSPIPIRINVTEIKDVSCSIHSSGCLSQRIVVSITHVQGGCLQLLTGKRHRVDAFVEELQRVRRSLQGSAVWRPKQGKVSVANHAVGAVVCVDVEVRDRRGKGGVCSDSTSAAQEPPCALSSGDPPRPAPPLNEEVAVVVCDKASLSSCSALPVSTTMTANSRSSSVRQASAVELNFRQPSIDSASPTATPNRLYSNRRGGSLPPLKLPPELKLSVPPRAVARGSLSRRSSFDSSSSPPTTRASVTTGQMCVASTSVATMKDTVWKVTAALGNPESRVALPLSDGKLSPMPENKGRGTFGLHVIGQCDGTTLRCSLPLMGTVPGDVAGEDMARQLAEVEGLDDKCSGVQPPHSAMAPDTPLQSAPAQTPLFAVSTEFALDHTGASDVDGPASGGACSPATEFSGLPQPVQVGPSPLLDHRPGTMLLTRQHSVSIQRYSSHWEEVRSVAAEEGTISLVEPTHDEEGATNSLDGDGLVSTNTETLLSPESILALRAMQGLGGNVEDVLEMLAGGVSADDSGWVSRSDSASGCSGMSTGSGQLLSARRAAMLYEL